MIKKHKQPADPVRQGALRILNDFDRRPKPLPEMIEENAARGQMSTIDQSFMQHLVYGVIRNREKLDSVIEKFVKQKDFRKNRMKANILRLGALQLMPGSKVPKPAAINESIKLIRATLGDGLTGFINAVLRRIADDSDRLFALNPNPSSLADMVVRFSQPDWLVEMLVSHYGEQRALEFLSAFEERLPLSVRINTWKTTKEEFENELHELNFEVRKSELLENYYYLPDGVDPNSLSLFTDGECFAQNIASGLVVELIAPEPESKIVDLCAAPGGKTAAMFLKTDGTARITALDVDTRKVDLIKQNLTRLALTGIRVGTADARRFEETGFDTVLVDAPCSGIGTLAKHPEIKYTQSPENIQKLANLQFEILDNTAKVLNKGGVMVYSVCTLTPDETDRLKATFLETHSNFNIELPDSFRYHRFVQEDKSILVPPGDGLEGMYAFRVRKTR